MEVCKMWPLVSKISWVIIYVENDAAYFFVWMWLSSTYVSLIWAHFVHLSFWLFLQGQKIISQSLSFQHLNTQKAFFSFLSLWSKTNYSSIYHWIGDFFWEPVSQKIKKSPGHEIFFCPNSIFCNFKNGQKSIFKLGKSFKLTKMQFNEKIFLIHLTSRYFCLDFFQFSAAAVVLLCDFFLKN